MSTQSLEQAIAATREVLAGVKTDQLDDPTPCSSWKARDLINHIVGGHRFFGAALRGEQPDGEVDDASGDFVAAFDDVAAQTVAGFSVDGALDKSYTLPFGEMPGSAFMGLATTDTFVHAWDLAKATGQATDLDPPLAAALLEQAEASIPDAFRGPEGAPFGPQQDAPSGATDADRLAAFLGRIV